MPGAAGRTLEIEYLKTADIRLGYVFLRVLDLAQYVGNALRMIEYVLQRLVLVLPAIGALRGTHAEQVRLDRYHGHGRHISRIWLRSYFWRYNPA